MSPPTSEFCHYHCQLGMVVVCEYEFRDEKLGAVSLFWSIFWDNKKLFDFVNYLQVE